MARRTFLWCDRCRRSFDYPDAPGGLCPICGSEMRELGWMSAFVRGFLAQELSSSGIASRHRQIIRQIWTANGMGERYYKVLAPPVTYARFEARVTEFVCVAAAEGWVRFSLPASPLGMDDSAYRMEIDDEERFIAELASIFDASETDER
ncbi:MAG TPA: hypothetical protein PKA95_04295 [Thermomicrobiales bacterium]|nr:hypothetical protein [Thermomicrobiales bacterium]